MNDDFLSRTRLLLGEEALERLAGCRVAVFGVVQNVECIATHNPQLMC